ncbi:hypothetical protein [Desulforamulus hydrothermalis]|uniref:Lipoprotein n=1 Tax=Desulforamulus hydrothermalis Lam5 = DSM 18033 TaxID=1121428 RepID=K8EFZ7_9FIRM|nr:hypothetical protein [Desulforamulus hydrothermalis]CCO07616.1 conserved exported hypothetical protein [Desulforamulus hydrothermalis Lam5 = DSM 18033]SHH19831.1 hypothetical protein SAMN02745177_01787 [Desulforamulus hydrothermalis Lam5 = DSM 18033]
MRKKITLWLVLIMAAGLLVMGCGQSKTKVEVKTPEEAARMEGDPVQNLIIKEREWLGRLDAEHAKIGSLFSAWQQGQATREDFMQQLTKSKRVVRGLIKEYDLHMEVNSFPEDKKNQAVYQEGLAYGDKLRTAVNNFIFMATEGVMDAETKQLKPLTDEQVKELYQKYMVEKYEDYKAKLTAVLEKNK